MNPLNLIPAPYRLFAVVVAIALIVLAIFSLGWSKGASHVQAKWDVANAKAQQVALAAEQSARAKEQANNQRLQEAQNAATEREKKLRADADAARAAAGSLRDTVAALRDQLSTATLEASRRTADACLAVFGECTDQYREVAAAADGHASDTAKLSDAWPE